MRFGQSDLKKKKKIECLHTFLSKYHQKKTNNIFYLSGTHSYQPMKTIKERQLKTNRLRIVIHITNEDNISISKCTKFCSCITNR